MWFVVKTIRHPDKWYTIEGCVHLMLHERVAGDVWEEIGVGLQSFVYIGTKRHLGGCRFDAEDVRVVPLRRVVVE